MPDYSQRPTCPEEETRAGYWVDYNQPPPGEIALVGLALIGTLGLLVLGVGYAIWTRL